MRRPVERLRTLADCRSALGATVAKASARRLKRLTQHSSIFLNTMKDDGLQSSYEFGPFRLEVVRRRLMCGEEVVQLRPKAIETLLLLIKHRDRILSKEELLGQLWPNTVVEEANLTQYIYLLRKTLGKCVSETGTPHEYILTVPGHGYRFVAIVREEPGIDLVRQDLIQAPGMNERTATDPPLAAINIGRLHNDSPAGQSQTIELPPVSHNAGARQPHKQVRLVATLVTLALALAVVTYLVRGKTDVPTGADTWSLTRLTNTGNVPWVSIAPDGSLISYVVADGGRQSLWIRQLATSNEVQIVSPSEVFYGGITFSPDGRFIYYVSRRRGDSAYALFQISAIGGAAKKLKAGLDSPISLSPDGTQYVFVRESAAQEESALLLASTDGGVERQLAARKLPEIFDYPAWSPDGKVIACTLVNPVSKQHVSVVEVRVADGNCSPVGTRTWAYALTPQWASDGRSLFITALEEASQSIWQLPYPHGEARRLTNDLTNYLRISLAAKAQALVTIESSVLSNLWVVTLGDTSRAKQLFSGIGRYGRPAWTPAGKIVYASEANGNWDIWLMEADGTGRQQLTADASGDTDPSVSPDGRYIAFTSDQADHSNIWRIDADGANRKQLTFSGRDLDPQCTPDGKWIVYNSFSATKPYTVFKVPLHGGVAVQLTSASCRAPAVSPDGRWIACLYSGDAVSAQVEPTAIAVVPIEGGAPRKVGHFLSSMVVANLDQLGWTPDGRNITYVDNRGGHANLWGQPLDGGPVKPLTDFHDGQLLGFNWSPDGQQLVCLRGTLRQDMVLIRNFR